VSDDWVQPHENSLASLRHGILNCDGIEFDLRLTADRELIVHHDAKVSVKKLIGKSNPYVEGWHSEDLKALGFSTLKEVLEDKIILEHWREQGKMVCLEFKRPSPKSPLGGGYFAKQKITELLAEMITKSEQLLEEYEIPKGNSVFYAFHNCMHKSVKLAQSKRNWAELLPVVPRFGNSQFKRMFAYPQYFITPFSRLVNKHKKRGSSMVPCAIEYFQPFYNRALLGRSVGLSGRKLKHFHKCQSRLPVYVWPAKEKYEKKILTSGLTGLTDNLDPNYTWLPSGDARWTKPATRPLDQEQLTLLNEATYENHKDILKQLNNEVPEWKDCDSDRKQLLIESWNKRWNWDIDVKELVEQSVESPPWQSVRLIGHRGSGKTGKPLTVN